ncbi:MAG TPA: hypothetical protein VFQ25_02470 [Ktedonobacterales bacterium]|nr:hypothetical protein [Ktedonobacterales bacterium]
MSQASDMLTRRPGMVTFAAVMMFIAGGFEVVFAISEFSNAAWLSNTAYGDFGGYFWLWGIVDLVLAAIVFYAGYDLLRGGQFGFILGVFLAVISSIRWFFFIPWAPFLALAVIAVDLLIIFGLTANADYFRQSSRAM